MYGFWCFIGAFCGSVLLVVFGFLVILINKKL